MNPPYNRHQSWSQKFARATTGIVHAVKEQSSFYVHLPIAAVVAGCGVYLRLDFIAGSLLAICIGLVLMAELFNTSLEYLAQAITDQQDERIRWALDIASGAVLLIVIAAVIVGSLVFGNAIFYR